MLPTLPLALSLLVSAVGVTAASATPFLCFQCSCPNCAIPLSWAALPDTCFNLPISCPNPDGSDDVGCVLKIVEELETVDGKTAISVSVDRGCASRRELMEEGTCSAQGVTTSLGNIEFMEGVATCYHCKESGCNGLQGPWTKYTPNPKPTLSVIGGGKSGATTTMRSRSEHIFRFICALAPTAAVATITSITLNLN